jgi:hypothetical protein
MNLVTFRGLLAHVGVDILIFTLIVLLLGVAVVTKTHPHGNALYAAEFDFVPDSSWVRIDPLDGGFPIYRSADCINVTFRTFPKRTTREVVLGKEMEDFYVATGAKIISKRVISKDWIEFVLEKNVSGPPIHEVDLFHFTPADGILVHISGTSDLHSAEENTLAHITFHARTTSSK